MKSPTNDTDQNLTTAEPTTCETASAAAPPHFHPQNPTDNPGECESAIHPVPAIPTGSQSTIPSKLTPEELAAVHEALADPDRAPYGVIFDKLALREKGIGFTAFYNYARPIRLHEACLNQAGLSRTLAPHAHKLMPDLIAARLLAALVDETSPPRQIQFLVDAYRMASNLNLAHRRLRAQVKDLKRKTNANELQELSRTVKEFTRLRRSEIAASSPQAAEEQNDDE